MEEAPAVERSQTQQASPTAESSSYHNQGHQVVVSQVPVQNESSSPVSQLSALPTIHDDRKFPSGWASRKLPAALPAVSAPATQMIVPQHPLISPEQLMSQIIKLIELNNKKQDQQTSVNTYTIKGGWYPVAAEFLVRTRWHEYRDANNGVALEKVDYLSRVKAELEHLLNEPSRANWEYVTYSIIQEMVLNDVHPKISELKYISVDERTYWVRVLGNTICSANRELMRKCIANFSWEKLKRLAMDMELIALKFNGQLIGLLLVSYRHAMKACAEKWSKEDTLREFFAEQVWNARDQNAPTVEKRSNLAGMYSHLKRLVADSLTFNRSRWAR
jgi:hypothetical protein